MFTPQILENFRRSSATGLSLVFLIAWLLGDVFNILGAVLQGVIPTMTILAVYYTLADVVLLAQCFYYRGFTLSDYPAEEAVEEEEEEERPLLWRDTSDSPKRTSLSAADADCRRSSLGSFHDHLRAVDGTHLSPATPLRSPKKATDIPPSHAVKSHSALTATIYNTSALILVCAVGAFGWWLSAREYSHQRHHHDDESAAVKEEMEFDDWGQIFGYLCAVLYLGSRIPQLLLNYRRKSTEGVSMLFFIFACVGNLTYVLSIFAYEPVCARLASVDLDRSCESGEWRKEYGRYILVNLSWLIGSAGTLLLDMSIFAQFWIYRGSAPEEE